MSRWSVPNVNENHVAVLHIPSIYEQEFEQDLTDRPSVIYFIECSRSVLISEASSFVIWQVKLAEQDLVVDGAQEVLDEFIDAKNQVVIISVT